MNQPVRAAMRQVAALVSLCIVLLTAGPALAVFSFQLGSTTGSGNGDLTETLPAIGAGEIHLMTNVPSAFAGGDVGATTGANTFYANGITGQNAVISNIEAGHIWNNHETLQHVSSLIHHTDAFGAFASALYDRHATWVGMMLGGRNAAPFALHKTGMAPGADLRSGAMASSWSGTAYATNFSFTSNSFVTPFANYFGVADVINSSWGFTDAAGSHPFTIAMDGMANANPSTTFVASAGNAGPTTNTVVSPGAGYNAITVAALANGGSNGYNAIANFSSRGPQSYSDPVNGSFSGIRAAVDIAAPGANLTSAYYGGQSGGNNSSLSGSPNGSLGGPASYSSSVQGTSFSAPIVAGAAALIDSASYNTPLLAANPFSRDARVVKAVLLNSARKIPGWTNGQTPHANGFGGVETSQSLDYRSGAGALDLDQAYDQYLSGATRDVPGTLPGFQGLVDTVGWDYGVLQDGIDNAYLIAQPLIGGSDLTVTLDWFRNRDFNPSTFNTTEISQVDLDLRIIDVIRGIVISESISGVNVVEHLHFSIPRTSLYLIDVNYFGNLFGATTSEEYGLAWRGTPTPEPGTLALVLLGIMSAPTRRRRRTPVTAS